MLTVGVALAAGLGAVLRYVIDQLVQHRTRGDFPYGTVVINITGSFLLGLATGLALHHGLGTTATVIIGTGFAGGYTTLSTWAWETLALTESGDFLEASANIIGSFAAGLAAAAAGLGLALL
ncbi:MAG TPA: fluoride efflux transporter CrcB [Jatrophihabitantaceae bacterium]|jgi:CrcB protein|nr:fluoride efflux transporter CrcB [Jatrophihabitantaceae bacterium]